MEDWNDWDSGSVTPSSQPKSKTAETRNHPGTRKWHVWLTIVSFVFVAIASFCVSWFTREIPTRPAELLFLCFAAPVLALMIAVMLVEKHTNAMTPQVSRKAQTSLAAASVFVAGLVGLFCGITNVEASEPIPIVVNDTHSDAIVLLDKSGSMVGANADCIEAVQKLLDSMDDSAQMGIIFFSHEILDEVTIAPLSEAQRQIILQRTRQVIPQGMTDFELPMDAALQQAAQWQSNGRELSIIFITDGNSGFQASKYRSALQQANIKLHVIRIGSNVQNSEMDKLVADTKGKSILQEDASNLLASMQEVLVSEGEVKYIYQDALRDIDQSTTATVAVGILLGILGILLGVTLTIMFSLQGQRRAQLFISPLMAVLAFLILRFSSSIIDEAWLREFIAFSLFGVVFMCKNNLPTTKTQRVSVPAQTSMQDDDNW